MKSKLIHLVFLNILIALFLFPALAQEGEEAEEIEESTGRGEFFFSVEDWFVKPGNMDYQIATILPVDPWVKSSPNISIPSEYDHSLKYKIGWKFKDNLGTLAFVYWSSDNEEKMTRTAPGNFVFTQNLSFPLFAGVYDDGMADGVHGELKVQTQSMSLLFSRDFTRSEKVHASWKIGIRQARLEQQSYVQYLALLPTLIDPFPNSSLIPLNDSVREYSDYKALGMELGSTFYFPIASRVSLGADLGISLLRGKLEAKYVSSNYLYTDEYSSYFRVTETPLDDNDLQWVSTVFANGTEPDSIAEILDADIKVIWNVWNGFDLTFGYAISLWSGALLREELQLVETSPANWMFIDYSQFARPYRQDIAFEGAYLRITYRY